MGAPRTTTQAPLCLLFCLFAFLGNWFGLELFHDVDFLSGSFFVMLAILTLGGTCGVVTAVVAGACTHLLWNHPWAIVTFTGEAVVVSRLVARRGGNLVVYDLLYWVCLGVPAIYLLYHHVMGADMGSTLVIMLKQPVNGVFNALMAMLASILVRSVGRPAGARAAYGELLFTVTALFALVPVLILSITEIRAHRVHETDALGDRVAAVCRATRKSLAAWLAEHHKNVQILAELVGDPAARSFAEMEHYVEIIKAASPAFKGMGVFDNHAVTVAYAPPVQDGMSNLGVDFSFRPHVAVMRRDKAPYISDMMTSALGAPTPIVLLLAPIVLSGEYRGYCSGVVEIPNISNILANLKEPGLDIAVVDGKNRVIATTLAAFRTMAPFERPYPATGENTRAETVLWKPDPRPNTSRMQQWRDGFLFGSASVSEACGWRVVVEASFLPLTDEMARFGLQRLSLVSALILVTIFCSFLLSNGFIAGIRKLQSVTGTLPQRIDDAASIDWPRSVVAEIGDLSDNFRTMAAALQEVVTQRARAEREREKIARQRQLALDAARLGWWRYDPATGVASWDERYREIFGVTGHSRPNDEILARIHPDDLPGVWARVEAALRPEDPRPYCAQFRIRPPGGPTRWIEAHGLATFEGEGGERRAVSLVGTVADITARKRAAEALAASERKYRALIETANSIILRWDRQGVIRFINTFGCRFFGYDADELVGRDVTTLVPRVGTGSGRDLDALVRDILARPERYTLVPAENIRKDGGTVWVAWTNKAVLDGSGGVREILAIGNDITALKETEAALVASEESLRTSLAEKEVLLKEIHHRVKNNMQVITSLVGLQAGEAGDPALRSILQDVIDRVRSMAMVHEKLYQSADLARVEFADYTASLLGYLQRAHAGADRRVHVDLDLRPVHLPVSLAVPCGLILNELFGNALRHAFEGRDRGRLTVSLRETDRRVRLVVEDDGVGLPPETDRERAPSLGLRIVRTLVRQIDASLAVDAAGGTRFTLTFERGSH